MSDEASSHDRRRAERAGRARPHLPAAPDGRRRHPRPRRRRRRGRGARRPLRRHDRHDGARSRLPAGLVDAVRPRLEGRRHEPRPTSPRWARSRRPWSSPSPRRRRLAVAVLEGIADGLRDGLRRARARLRRRRAATSRPPTPSRSPSRRSATSQGRAAGAALRSARRRRRRARRRARRSRPRASACCSQPGSTRRASRCASWRTSSAREHPTAHSGPARARPRRSRAGLVAAIGGATAMLDVSDGLALDAGRIARASGVGIDFDSAALGDDTAARSRRRRGPRAARDVPGRHAVCRRRSGASGG